MERRLAGILAADVVGYSALVGTDEPGTLARVRALRAEVIEPLAAAHHGRLFKTTGDGFLLAFASAVEAVSCAIAIQARLREDTLRLRIGVHQGEVVPEGDDLLGDGVIVAARLEPLAEPGGIVISARVREDVAGKVAIEVDDLGEPALKNIARPLRVYRVRLAGPARTVLALPDKPSLVVLPFQNMSGHAEQEYFADGMVEDITTSLSRIGGLFVIARNSAFTYKGRPIDVKEVGRELGVRYVVEGSVRKAGGRVRITAQLIEAASALHLWADRFDSPLDDIFDLQDRVTEAIAGAIEPTLQNAEIDRALSKPTANLDAYDLYLRATRLIEQYTPADLEAATDILRTAIRIDPRFSLGKALFSYAVGLKLTLGILTRNSAEMAEAVDMARAALADARDDPRTLRLAGASISYNTMEKSVARAALDRAVALNPNSSFVRTGSGWVNLQSSAWQAALDDFNIAIRLSPLAPDMRYTLTGLSCALFELGRAEEALGYARKSLAIGKGRPFGANYVILALWALGRLDEARTELRTYLKLHPGRTLEQVKDDLAFWPPDLAARRIAIYRELGFPE